MPLSPDALKDLRKMFETAVQACIAGESYPDECHNIGIEVERQNLLKLKFLGGSGPGFHFDVLNPRRPQDTVDVLMEQIHDWFPGSR